MTSATQPGFITVLVADDSAVVRQRLCRLLHEEECIRVVGEARGAVEALTLFSERRPKAVVLDIQMPDGSGVQVLRRIKQSSPECVVIMLTSFLTSEFRYECHRAGADFFFHKATEFESVVSVLRELACASEQSRSPGTATDEQVLKQTTP